MKFFLRKILLISFFIFPTFAFASVFLEQTDSSTLGSVPLSNSASDYYIFLDRGRINNFSDISVYLKSSGDWMGDYPDVRATILCYDSLDDLINLPASPSCGFFDIETKTIDSTSKTLYNFSNVTKYQFEADKFYTLGIYRYTTPGSTTVYIYGSTSSTMELWNQEGSNLEDIYMVLNDTDPPASDLSGNYFTNYNPQYGSTTASTLVYSSFDFYNTGYGYPNYGKVCESFYNLEASALQTNFQKTICFDLNATGVNHFATTTTLAQGLTSAILYQWDEGTNNHALSTTTEFIVVYSDVATSTAVIEDCTKYSWSTEASQRLACVITNAISSGIRFLFFPSSTVLTNIVNLKDQYAHKPPFGYVSAISDTFQNATTSVSGTINIPYVNSTNLPFLDTFRTGLNVILYFMLGIYLFVRFKNFQFK